MNRYRTIDNLSYQELKNILKSIHEYRGIFSSDRAYIEVKTRFDVYHNRLRFVLTIPEAWIPSITADAALDAIKRGVL